MERLRLALGLVRWSLCQCRTISTRRTAISLKQLNPLPTGHTTGTTSSPSASWTPSSTTGLSTSRHPLQGEKPRQFLTSDKETIVCVHPTLPVDVSSTTPLRPYKPELALLRTKLNSDETAFVKKLRSEDPSLWSVATLARLFNVKRTVISRVAPADKAHQEELEREKRALAHVKSYRRKIILAEKQMKRQKQLEQAIKESDYKFPNSLN